MARLPRILGRRRRVLIGRLVVNGLLQAGLTIAIAALLRVLLAREVDFPERHAAAIAACGLGIVGLRVVEAGDAERLGQDYVTRVRLRIFQRLAEQPMGRTRHRRLGVTMARVISDLNSLRNWVSLGIARVIVASLTMAGVLAATFHIAPLAAAVAASVVGLSSLLTLALTPELRRRVRTARKRRGRLANHLGERLVASAAVRQLERTRSETRRIAKNSTRLARALVARMRLAAVVRSSPEAAIPIATAGIALLAPQLGLPASDLVVFVLLLAVLASALRDLARSWDYRIAFEEGRYRIEQLLSAPRLRELPDARTLPDGPLSVRLDEVCVARTLESADFDVPPGQRVRVEAETSDAAATLVALLVRRMDPTRGRVSIGGVPLREVALASLHSSVQCVTPELPLLRGSVADNVDYGARDAPEGWRAQILQACGIEQGGGRGALSLSDRVEEGGLNLGSGSRARVALARAALLKPRVLLVDDPAFRSDSRARVALRDVVDLLGATTFVVDAGPEPLLDFDEAVHVGSPAPHPARATLRPVEARA